MKEELWYDHERSDERACANRMCNLDDACISHAKRVWDRTYRLRAPSWGPSEVRGIAIVRVEQLAAERNKQ